INASLSLNRVHANPEGGTEVIQALRKRSNLRSQARNIGVLAGRAGRTGRTGRTLLSRFPGGPSRRFLPCYSVQVDLDLFQPLFHEGDSLLNLDDPARVDRCAWRRQWGLWRRAARRLRSAPPARDEAALPPSSKACLLYQGLNRWQSDP